MPHVEGLTYDPGSAGGCTVVETDRDGNRIREYVAIAGTVHQLRRRHHALGHLADLRGDRGARRLPAVARRTTATSSRSTRSTWRANRDPQPIKALGRFAHEAAVVDPKSGDILLTEDAATPNGLLYRWAAPKGFKGGKGALRKLGPTEGELGAMRCTDQAGVFIDDISRATEIGTTYKVTWTPVPDRDARTTSIRTQFGPDQVTRGRKIEGAWWGDGGAYVVASYAREESPGAAHDGQVWFYDPKRSTLTLKVRFGVNPNPDQDGAFDGPDNITVSPWGGLIIAEDGEGVQHLVGVSGKGEPFELARNELGNGSEFTGPVFSHDKKVLFGSIQTPGIMFAITGPWKNNK